MDLRKQLDQLSESSQPDFIFRSRDEPSHNIVKVETIGNGGSLVRLSKLVYCSDFFRRGFAPIATISTDNQGENRQAFSVRDAKLCMKPKRTRTSFTASQLQKLEEEFRLSMYVVGVKRMQLASNLNLSEKQVKVWFQNRRMKYKRERAKERGQTKEDR